VKMCQEAFVKSARTRVGMRRSHRTREWLRCEKLAVIFKEPDVYLPAS
jgi:hypothetical protein